MIHDDYSTFRLYVPLGMIVLLMIMIYFHRHNALKYLYIVNVFFLFTAVVSYLITMRYPVGHRLPEPWMQPLPFVWLFGIFGGYALSVFSLGAFMIDMAQRHLLAKVLVGFCAFVLFLLGIYAVFLFIAGILSLKSG